ncbi:MAG: hypothetical protein ABH857_01495 [Elusimicrobiota bacterium]
MKIKLLLLLFIILMITSNAFSAFRNMNWHTRARAMGGAFTAVSNDMGAMTYNVGALGYIDWIETNFMYSRLFTGLDGVDMGLAYAGFIYPLNDGTFGLDWSRFVSNDLYSEDIVQLNYGYVFTNALFAGIGLSYLHHGYVLDKRTVDDPVFADKSSDSGIGISLGGKYILYDYNLAVGVNLRNINKPDVGLKTKDIVPPEYRLGLAYTTEKFVIPVDVYFRDQEWGNNKDKWGIAIGGEYNIASFIAVRAGYGKNEVTSGFSIIRDKIFGDCDIVIDYALIWPLTIEETTGSHQLSIIFRFGRSE